MTALVDLTLTLTKLKFIGLLIGTGGLDGVTTAGDVGVLPKLLAVLDENSQSFAIVTP